MQIRTSVVDDKLSKWLRSGFRLVQIYTSVVEEEVTTMIWNGFRLVQICTSVVEKKNILIQIFCFRLVQNCTSVVGQSRQNNQWYFVIKHQTYFIDALIYILYHFQTQMSIESGYFTQSIFITSRPLFCIHYTTLSSSTKV